MLVRFLAALGLLAVTACGSKHPAPQPTPTVTPAMLIGDRGITMSLSQVRSQTAFRAFIPRASGQVFAVIPPLGGADTRANRGLAVEYDGVHGARVVLSEWPAQSFAIRFGKHDLSGHPCTLVEYAHSSFAFTTRSGLVATVLGDAGSSRADVRASAQEAMARGCGPTTPTSR